MATCLRGSRVMPEFSPDDRWHSSTVVSSARRGHFEVLAPGGQLFRSDCQSMGFGLASAIGAKLAALERPVVAVIGDSGFAVSDLEVLTAVRANVSLTVVVFNDGELGRIRLEQLTAHGRMNSVELRNSDFEAFARSIGANCAAPRHVRGATAGRLRNNSHSSRAFAPARRHPKGARTEDGQWAEAPSAARTLSTGSQMPRRKGN